MSLNTPLETTAASHHKANTNRIEFISTVKHEMFALRKTVLEVLVLTQYNCDLLFCSSKISLEVLTASWISHRKT